MIKKIKPNIFQLFYKKFGSCVYLLLLENQKIIIDTSSEDNKQEIIDDLNSLGIKPSDINIILLTHKHYDHTGNLELFNNAQVYDYSNIDQFHFNNFQIIKTPGHTKDSLAFLHDNILFSGDTLFHNGIGRTDLPESIPEKMDKSLETLKNRIWSVPTQLGNLLPNT